MLRYTVVANRIENLQNGGHHRGSSLPCPSMGVPTVTEYSMECYIHKTLFFCFATSLPPPPLIQI